MLSALWLVPIAAWLSYGYGDAERSPLDLLYFALTALFWIGHRACSLYLAYCTEAYRPLVRAQPGRFVVAPLLVAVGCFAVLLPPDGALPWSRPERLVALAVLDYACVVYHFAAQHFGALSLYRTRVEGARRHRSRRMDRLFALGIGGGLVFLADVLAGSAAYPGLGIVPDWIAPAHHEIRAGAMLVLLVATAAMLLAERRAPVRSMPRILYVVGIAAMVAVALDARSPFLFLVIWTSQHWILATGLASRAPTAEAAPPEGAVRRMLHAVNVRPWAIVLLLVVASIALLPFFEVEANRQEGTFYGEWIFGAFAAQLRTSVWAPALVALGFATGFTHYLLDRSVFRLSDARVRVAASGLLHPHRGYASSSSSSSSTGSHVSSGSKSSIFLNCSAVSGPRSFS